MSSSNQVFRIACDDRTGGGWYSVNMLREFGNLLDLTQEKVAQLWEEAKKHDVLFSDYTAGRIEPFIAMLLDPRSVWLEIVREHDNQIVGAVYATNVIPGHDAEVHFTFWDSVASGREPIVWAVMAMGFDRYHLMRMTTEIPPHQTGTIRFVKKLGFVQEGERRNAIVHKGAIKPLFIFGILKEELLEKISNERSNKGQSPVGITDGDAGSS